MLMADPGTATIASPSPTRDPVAQRILVVLEACAAIKRPVAMIELVDATGLAKTTVHRMCWKLAELGLLERTDEGFSIGTKVFALANANPIIRDVRAAAMPYLIELQRLTGASDLAVLTDGKALILDGLFTQELRSPPLIGVAVPLHCTAVGKAIAASLDIEQRERLLGRGLLPAVTHRTIVHPVLIRRHLERVTAEGVAISHEEFQVGTAGVAAAFTVRGDVTFSIGCVGTWNNSAIPRSSARVAAAAADLQRALAETEQSAC
jgi:DNA-binding IclR family transcriptional regulator